jgi:hypothetical protein
MCGVCRGKDCCIMWQSVVQTLLVREGYVRNPCVAAACHACVAGDYVSDL